jgi:hypothetical protein
MAAYERSLRAIRNVRKARQDAVAAAETCKRLREAANELLREPVFPEHHFASPVSIGPGEPDKPNALTA